MRRRKQRNPLLKWIIVITILLHIILLPILAKFGAFKRARSMYTVGEVKMVTLPPTPPPVKPPDAKKEAKAKPPKPSPTAKQAKTTTPHQSRSATRTALSQPHVAVASGGGGDTGGGVADPGTGKAGELPTVKADTTQPTIKAADPAPIVKAEPKPDPKPEPIPIVKAEPKPVPVSVPEPKPVPVPTPEPKPVPHVPVYTEAAQTFAPQPAIPDDLRGAALDTTVVVEIIVDENGSAADVKLAKPTGNDELDRIALDTARKWKFKPALRDGQPVQSRVRLHIEFQVS